MIKKTDYREVSSSQRQINMRKTEEKNLDTHTEKVQMPDI